MSSIMPDKEGSPGQYPLTFDMKGPIWFMLVFVPGMLTQTFLKGFDILDNFSEEFTAGENVVTAETPHSHQLSVCMWFNPKWARRSM